MKILTQYIKTPVGELILGSYNNQLCLADWRYRKMRKAIDARIKKGLDTDYQEGNSAVLTETEKQLNSYFLGDRTTFEIPLLLVGTDFQKKVWKSLLEVPYGKTNTYMGLSTILGDVKAIRAVATANGANAISIIVPCHRIIGSNGDLVGYAGGLPAKKKLLELENPLRKSQMKMF
tara:strand:- start:102367 stop:102894 length:528 start_codon:yes stop_codon:yes gene_type:complete